MKTLAAIALTVAALTALLAGWFTTGWRAVEAEQRAIRSAPEREARASVERLATELGSRLEEVRASEERRPYYQYGNLYHDPRGAHGGRSVIPSPLASGPTDSLILAHFQIDAAGLVTTPTINPEVPELSQQEGLARNRELLAQLDAIAPELRAAAPEARPVVAAVTTAPKKRRAEQNQRQEAAQVLLFPREVYVQNAMPNQVFHQLQSPPVQQETQQAVESPPPPRRAPSARRQQQAKKQDEVAVVTEGFSWRTIVIGGAPRLVALRHVTTPDGVLTQGFVVERATLDAWLADRQPASAPPARVVEARPAPDQRLGQLEEPIRIGGEPDGPDWRVAVDASDAQAAANARSATVSRRFLQRLVPTAALALLCGLLLVVLVARADASARQHAHFAAAAAHELRTPLAGLQLYGDMLAGGLGRPDRAREYAERIAEEAGRLGRVVGNVLGFTQLERGTLAARPEQGDACAAARAAVERARPTLERQGKCIDLELPATPLEARFDADAVARILGNLLDNADKHARDGADGMVHVHVASAGDVVEVSVVDHGPGVPRRARRRLFRPFQRAVAADGPAGLGLGLALARALARAQRGDLLHHVTPGGGATFVLRLPRA